MNGKDILIADKFFAAYKNSSRAFLESANSLGGGCDINVFELSGEFKEAFLKIDQSTLFEYLERSDCPDWLGIWAANFGFKVHQLTYLFSPNLSGEMSIEDHVSARSPEIKKLFWKARSPAVLSSLLNYDDMTYLAWARDIGFDEIIKTPSLDFKEESEYVGTVRGQIVDWFTEKYDPVVQALWDKYVPKEGECDVLQGELARCILRLQGEYWRNGMCNMGGEGNGTYEAMVDLIKDTLRKSKQLSTFVMKEVDVDASIIKGANYEQIRSCTILQTTDVEASLCRLHNVVAAWCLKNPEPILVTN